MVPVAQDNVHYLSDGPCFVWSAVHIENRDRFGEGPGCQSALVDITPVYEESSGSGINESLNGHDLLGVRGDNLDLDVQGVGRGSGGDHVLPWKPSFPAG